jgi:hypothetical protein
MRWGTLPTFFLKNNMGFSLALILLLLPLSIFIGYGYDAAS